jgi:hypothetical protein
MPGAQASCLKTLCDEAGEMFDPNLNKAGASKMTDAMQARLAAAGLIGPYSIMAYWSSGLPPGCRSAG